MENSPMHRRAFIKTMGSGGVLLAGGGMLQGCRQDPAKNYVGNKWWQQGYNTPVQAELDLTEFKVEGEIPVSLNGLYVRNGGNEKGGLPQHYFNGDGMLHGVWLEEGRVRRYRNRWVQTGILGEGKTAGLAKEDNLSNTAIVHHGGKLLSLQEAGWPYEINKDLSTKGPYNFDGDLTTVMTAHPKFDPDTGEMHFYGMDFLRNPYLTYWVADAAGRIIKSVPIELPGSSMQHDFQLTKNYALFLDMPIVFSLAEAITGGFPYRWQGEEYGARLGVLPRSGGSQDIRWFEIDVGFSFHTMNAWEDPDRPGHITLMAEWTESMWKESTFDLHSVATPRRWEIDLTRGRVREEQWSDLPAAFGKVDDRFAGRPTRSGFFMRLASETEIVDAPWRFSGLERFDLSTGQHEGYVWPDHEVPAEFIFEPDGTDAEEGDGYFLGFVYDRRTEQSTLDILHASNLPAGPVARIHLGTRVPLGFHGCFVRSIQ